MMFYGLCETEFKSRFYNHLHSFKHCHKASATELSKNIVFGDVKTPDCPHRQLSNCSPRPSLQWWKPRMPTLPVREIPNFNFEFLEHSQLNNVLKSSTNADTRLNSN